MVNYGVLVISHGSRSRDWIRLVDDAAAGVRLCAGVPLVSAFLEIVEGRLIQDGIDELERQGVTDIVVVPLFVSSGSTHIDEISYALGVIPEPKLETDLQPFRVGSRIHWCEPIDDDPQIACILYEKIGELSVHPASELLVLIGHGSREPGFHERWRHVLSGLAERVKALGGFGAADTAMLLPDEAGEVLRRWRQERPELDAIIVPVFLSEGYFTKQVIPERLSGLTYRYNARALLPHPLVTRWMERRLMRFGLSAAATF